MYIYDIVQVYDSAYASRRSVVHVYDAAQVYDYAYASRRNVIHAYDIIAQLDSAARSGNITVSVRDILTVPEWFFRVNKALKIFEFYAPFELAVVSTPRTIHAKDLSVVYDLGAQLSAVKTVSVLDKLVADGASYTKSYSPLFFTLFQRKVPVRYLTLSVLDLVPISESADLKKTVVVSASDYIVLDAVAYSKSYSPLFFTLFRRRVPIRYLTLSVSDNVSVPDSASLVKIKVLSVLDIVYVADYVGVRRISVHASDYVIYDYVPNMSPSDVRYISLYANVGMRSISVFDKIVPYESVWVGPRVITVHVRDYIVSDGASAVRRSIHAYDIIQMRDNANIVRIT